MSVDGQYKLSLKTPMGAQEGMLWLKRDGDTLSGSLRNPKGEVAFEGGTVDGDSLTFDTRIPTPIGKLKAHVTGRVEGDRFTGTAKLPLGAAEIEGERVA